LAEREQNFAALPLVFLKQFNGVCYVVIVKGMGDQFFRVDQPFLQPVDNDREFVGVQARGKIASSLPVMPC
jgi:hypothetical protein